MSHSYDIGEPWTSLSPPYIGATTSQGHGGGSISGWVGLLQRPWRWRWTWHIFRYIMHDIIYIVYIYMQYIYICTDVDPCCDGEQSCLHEIWFGKSGSTCYPSLQSVPKWWPQNSVKEKIQIWFPFSNFPPFPGCFLSWPKKKNLSTDFAWDCVTRQIDGLPRTKDFQVTRYDSPGKPWKSWRLPIDQNHKTAFGRYFVWRSILGGLDWGEAADALLPLGIFWVPWQGLKIH